MPISVGAYHNGTGNRLTIQGGLRARVASASQIDVEFSENVSTAPVMRAWVGGADRALTITRDAANPRLWHCAVGGAAITGSSGDVRLRLSSRYSDHPPFGSTADRGLFLKYDGTDMTPERAEYEEHIVPFSSASSDNYSASKPADTGQLDAIPSGAWSVICETPENLIAATAALRLNGARVMQWNGCMVQCQGFFRDIHWTWEMTVRNNQPALTGTTASEASDVFLVDEDGFDRSGTRRGGVDYGGRVVKLRKVWEQSPARYNAQNPPTSTTAGAAAYGVGWGASGARFVGATCGLGIQHAVGARPSWHDVRFVVDIPISGGSAGRLYGVACANALAHINISYEVAENWSHANARPAAYLARFDNTAGTANAHTPGYCRWRLVNVYPHLATATGSPSFDELVHLYGSHEARKDQARLNGSSTSTPTELEGYSADVTRMLLYGSFDLKNPRLDVSAIDRSILSYSTGDPPVPAQYIIDILQDIRYRVVGPSAISGRGRLWVSAGAPSSTLATSVDATAHPDWTVAASRALSGTVPEVSVWAAQGSAGLGDNRRVFLNYRRADLNFDAVAELEPDTENGARSADIVATSDPAFTGTPDQAAALTQFTISRTAKTITVTASATLQQLYNYCKHYWAETSGIVAREAMPVSLASGTLTLAEGWSIIVNTGVTLSGTGSANRAELSAAHAWPYPLPAWATGTTYSPGAIVAHSSRTWRTPSTVAGVAPGAPTSPWVDISRVGVLVLEGTGSLSALTYSDASGRAITVATEPGARVIASHAQHELRQYVPEASGGLLKCYTRGTSPFFPAAPVRDAAHDITLQGVTAQDGIVGISRVAETGELLVIAYNSTTRNRGIILFDGVGRQLARSNAILPQNNAPGGICHIGGDLFVVLTNGRGVGIDIALLSIIRLSDLRTSNTRTVRSTIIQEYRPSGIAWTGDRLLLGDSTGWVRQYVLAVNLFHDSGDRFTVGRPIRGMAVHRELGSSIGGLWLSTTDASGNGTDRRFVGGNNAHNPNHTGTFTMPGVATSSAQALTAFDIPTLATETLATAGADGNARFTVSALRGMIRVTAKKEGHDYASREFATSVPSHALPLPRNEAIDLAQDISAYNLTSTGGATNNVYAAPTAEGTGSSIYFSDTYGLKASPELSKRLLDAVLTTDEGLKILHRYSQAPSLNNNGRVVSFHPTDVNILPGWIAFVRKAGLPTGARAVFGAATYIGDDETYYRPRELNGGHVEIADPAIYVQFDSARTRTVSREIIEDPGNQAAIAGAVLDAVPESANSEDPANALTVEQILYALRGGPGSGGGGAALTQAQADAIARIPDPWPTRPPTATEISNRIERVDGPLDDVKGQTDQMRFVGDADANGQKELAAEVGTVTLPNNISVGEVALSQTSREAVARDVNRYVASTNPSDPEPTNGLGARVDAIKSAVDSIPTTHPAFPSIPSADDIADRVNSKAPPASLAANSIADRLSDIQGQTDKLQFDGSNNVQVDKTGYSLQTTPPSTSSIADFLATNTAFLNAIATQVVNRVPTLTDAESGVGRLVAAIHTEVNKLDFDDADGDALRVKATNLPTGDAAINEALIADELERDAPFLNAIARAVNRFVPEDLATNGVDAMQVAQLVKAAAAIDPPSESDIVTHLFRETAWTEMRADVALARKMQTNRLKRDAATSVATVYDDDGTTPIAHNDLKTREGTASEGGEVFERGARRVPPA